MLCILILIILFKFNKILVFRKEGIRGLLVVIKCILFYNFIIIFVSVILLGVINKVLCYNFR